MCPAALGWGALAGCELVCAWWRAEPGSSRLALYGGWERAWSPGGPVALRPPIEGWGGRAVLFVHKGYRLIVAPKSY